jgi:acyl-[acyl carrier protein]--UDP-N-acetylglucosamine O-acyltransferase
VPKRSSNPGLRPTKRESRTGRRRGPARGDLPHSEGGAGVRATEDTVFAAHPSAVIDPGAAIGAGTRIWHWSHVMTGAHIGRGCSLGQNVFVGTDVVIGDRVKIQNNVSVNEGVVIEDDVFCGPSMVFTNVINPRSQVPRKHEFRPTMVRAVRPSGPTRPSSAAIPGL